MITGEFLVNGRLLPKSFQRATGFVEQMDMHEATATVREALQYSALLRQPREVSKKEKMDYCETIIDLLEMRDVAGNWAGYGRGQSQRSGAINPKLSPFHYVLEGFLGAAARGQPVRCADNELARFSPPPNMICEAYTGAYISKAGGYVQTGTDGVCEFCQ